MTRILAFVAAALSLTLGVARAEPCPAPASRDRGRPAMACVAPWGVDLCAVTGSHLSFAVGTFQGGVAIPAGTRWSPIIGWGTNAVGGILPDLPLAYRADYVTAYPNDPMQDFISKLRKLRVVVDEGTPQERAWEFCDPADLAVVTSIGDYYGPDGLWGFSALNPGQWVAFAPALPPVAPGAHQLTVVWTLAAEHCDGFPSTGGEPLTVEGGHCIPASDLAFFPVFHDYEFLVAPRTH